jgi:aspartate/tyrosine/aromatic aminotransferase
VQPTPPDPILGLVAAFKLDSHPKKVNLAQGAYRTDLGEPFVLDVVRKAEQLIANDLSLNKEYLGVEGHPEFLRLTREFVFGNSAAVQQDRIATVQTLSGTGSLRVAAEFLLHFAEDKSVWLPNPSWGNHAKVMAAAGLEVKQYKYLDDAGIALDFEGMCSSLKSIPNGSTVLLHACAHNPTGVDPTHDQWREVANIFRQKSLLPFFDSAYQGYATGDPTYDAFSVQHFEEVGLLPMVCQSYAKNMGLYGERVGALNIMCASTEEAQAVLSQVKQAVIRPMYSSPPLHGARIAAAVLGDPELNKAWRVELKGMSDRIDDMRQKLTIELTRNGAPGDWSHIGSQIGMFAFTGLSAEIVDMLLADYHIYLTRDGRMSIAGLKGADIEYVAAAIKECLEKTAGSE